MTIPAIDRLARMQPAEVRFRVLCELRTGIGRIRAGVLPPRWERSDLVGAVDAVHTREDWAAAVASLRSGDFRQAHVALARHFRNRASSFVLNARDRETVAHAIRAAFPDAREDAVRRGDRLAEGRYDLLGYQDVAAGVIPDWHRDAVHGRRCPRAFWSGVRYLDPSYGDHKITWELNRHQHWVALGRAASLSGERKYYNAFTAQLASWMIVNPPLLGTNWASMLELAFRSLSWLWALELFAGRAGADDREPWLVDLLLGLDRQLTHVEQNLSHYFSPNTHLTGEALALYVAGAALPELKASSRRMAAGRDVLMREARRQIRADGGHAELSGHYHRYSTDFYLLATLVARRAGDEAAEVFQEAARAQARFLRTICTDSGERPLLGDDDGGQLFGICGRAVADCRDSLAIAAVVLNEPALALGPAPEEVYWVCGADAANAPAHDARQSPSAALPASGYFVSRTPRGDHLIFDAGPHGFLNGGHAHSDALACILSLAGRPFLIDPGTATYTMDPDLRNRFRGTAMHNTVLLDGRPQSETRGPFHWQTTTDARAAIWHSSRDCDYVEGSHDAYAPRRHVRGLLAIHGIGWWVIDHIIGDGHARAEMLWHLHPAWHCSIENDHVCSAWDGVALALASTASLALLAPGKHPLAVWSPVYGRIEPAPVVRGLFDAALPASAGTFIPATEELAHQVAIETAAIGTPPSHGWHGSAFRVRWSGGVMTLLASVDRSDEPIGDTSAPLLRWGTAELRTDARVAVLIERSTGACEVVLVNGSVLEDGEGRPLISLPGRVPLLRQFTDVLARTVHGSSA